MEIVCGQCRSKFRAVIETPLRQPVRVACPSCGKQLTLRPGATVPARTRRAIIADEPREFRDFLSGELQKLGFEVSLSDAGDEALELLHTTRAELIVLNVYLRGKLGVEISEEIRKDPTISKTKVVLIGALFRANRFRANPTNLYGADEYIEEQIPAKELRQIVRKLFPELGTDRGAPAESREYDEARRLARLILSDIIIYHAEPVERGIREGSFFDLLAKEIQEGREYYESRVAEAVRRTSGFFDETLHQFVEMKREELARIDADNGAQ